MRYVSPIHVAVPEVRAELHDSGGTGKGYIALGGVQSQFFADVQGADHSDIYPHYPSRFPTDSRYLRGLSPSPE